MKIGFPNHPRNNILEEIEWIGKQGFDFVDLFLEEDQAVPEKIDTVNTERIINKYNLGVVGHTAWYLPIGSPSKALREAALAESSRFFPLFSKLKAQYMTIHSNWPSGLFTIKEGIKFQVQSLRKLVETARKFDLEIIYEPIDTPKDNIQNVSEILSRVPELGLHIDIGHANMHGRKPEDFIKKFHDRLKHVHLHDNDGRKDLHLPMGAGSINWQQLIKTLKSWYDGTITLEVFSRDRDYVLMSRDKLADMWHKA